MSIHSTGFSHDEPMVVSPRRARHLLDIGNTKLYELLAARELESFRDGKSRKITVASIKDYIARKLAASMSEAA
jgi:excisionase family DNA binding protein